MSFVEITTKGDFSKTQAYLDKLKGGKIFDSLQQYAERGVAALAAATPAETGITAASWDYQIERHGGNFVIWWTNNHVDEQGTPIVIMLQMGHGTGTGGYVQGRNFINPAIRPVFDEIEQAVWREVTSG